MFKTIRFFEIVETLLAIKILLQAKSSVFKKRPGFAKLTRLIHFFCLTKPTFLQSHKTMIFDVNIIILVDMTIISKNEIKTKGK
jgi:hypothetical protein